MSSDCAWANELIAQRDARLERARQLSLQLDSQRETLERRAENAEKLQRDAEGELHRVSASIRDLRKNSRPEKELRALLAALVGGALAAWLACAAVALLVGTPRTALLMGIPATPAMAMAASRLPRLRRARERQKGRKPRQD